jgi:HSP20 family protein
MTLIRHRPLAELLSLPHAMERFFDDAWPTRLMTLETGVPALDIRETPESVVVKAALPGVDPKDVDVTVDGQLLTITGDFEKEVETKDEGWIRRELDRGSFSRSITLPVAARGHDATATFKDGLLTLTIPKAEIVQPFHVKVQGG